MSPSKRGGEATCRVDEGETDKNRQNEGQSNPLFGTQDVEVEISPISGLSELSSPAPLVSTPVESCTPEELLPETDDWFYNEGSPQPRPRPEPGFYKASHVFVTTVDRLERLSHDFDVYNAKLDRAIRIFNDASKKEDIGTLLEASTHMALHATKDMSWKKVLASKDRDKAIAALEKELSSLEGTILTRVKEGHPDYAKAKLEAITGRILLDIKRNQTYKARGVKQGFKEDKAIADGPDFNYYSHVAKLYTARMALFRSNRQGRRIALKDVSTAFLQSQGYDGFVKYVSFKHPVTGEWIYYEQSGPIYGEASAPVRWENTIAPFFEKLGFDRGENDPSVFYHPDRDLLVLLYVDDCLADGEEEDIRWFFDHLAGEYDCKDTEWLSKDEPLDYLGMEIFMDDEFLYLSMEKYIEQALDALGLADIRPAKSPINAPIEGGSPLDHSLRRKFMMAVGCIGWLVNTGRPDIAYAHSRVAQHMASPTTSAMDAVKRIMAYLKGAKDWCLGVPLTSSKECGLECESSIGSMGAM